MLMILSPAKTMDFSSTLPTRRRSTPACRDEAAEVISALRRLSTEELAKRMKLKPQLAKDTARQYGAWQHKPTTRIARPAVLAYRGNAYVGLDAASFNEDDFAVAQDRLRILSGLYGVLRPLDLVQPYRLETSRGRTLYEFWTETITSILARQLKKSGGVLFDLASGEYSRAVDLAALSATVVSASFFEDRNGRVGPVAAFAKKARGLMASFVIRERIDDVDEIRSFDSEGYRFDAKRSSEFEYVFTRKG